MEAERGRELLAKERQRIEQALADIRGVVISREGTSQDQVSSDQASDLTERLYEDRSEDELKNELAALERAEARLAKGTYGLSIESGTSIPDERLEANPLAERTVEEETRFERGRGP